SIPVDKETVFNIGSVSKVFTAAAVMLLVDEGVVDLDHPVTNYLPEFSMQDPRYREITVRMLLNHTSGIAGSTMANTFGYEYNEQVNSLIMKNINQSNLIHEPGAVAVYCNDGFALAEMIVERISGKPFIDYLSEEIFEPLGLENTGMSIKAKEKGVPAVYYSAFTGEREPQEVISSLGAGGLNSTVIDLCRFVDCFSDSGNILFSQSVFEEIRNPQPTHFKDQLKNPYMSFGLGWDYTSIPKYEQEGIQVIGKSGDSMNYAAMLLTVPEMRLSVAVIETGTNPEATLIADKVLEQVLIEKGVLKEREETVFIPLVPEPLPSEYNTFEGYYVGSSGDLFRVQVDEQSDTVNLFSISDGEDVPLVSFFFNNRYLYDESSGENKSYFIELKNKSYFVSSSFGMDLLTLEKIEVLEEPKTLMMDINEVRWLRRNVKPFEHKELQYNHIQQSYTFDFLPGYSFFNSITRIVSPTFAGYSAETARDQKFLSLFATDSTVWARTSDMIYSPAEEITVIENKTQSVTISSQGYNEWLMTSEDSIITFTIPETGRVVIFSPEGVPVYDSLEGKTEFYVEKNSFIEMIGYPGDIFYILAQAQ
ncbi:MAG: serine hydrolase domain-containing protein, partial [Thermotogota bacterium]